MEPIKKVNRPHNLRGENALAAIVFTDVESFTTKMAANEKLTLNLIERDFLLMENICQEYDGLVLKKLGDGLLIYFVSAEKAVNCAIAMQTSITTQAINFTEDYILKHRIGIHLGDVYFNGNDVMGNGVNMAARLQTFALAGGICISQTVYDVVKNRLNLPATSLGLKNLKGITEAVGVYQILPTNVALNCQKIFISYRVAEPDQTIAQQFHQELTVAGHQVFMAGESIRIGENWPQRIETELKQADYLLLFISEQSAHSEMVAEEVRRAKELQDNSPTAKPHILPIRVNLPISSPLNYNLYGYLEQIQQREWWEPSNTAVLLQEVLQLLEKNLSLPEKPDDSTNYHLTKNISKNCDEPGSRPMPSATPELPEGQVALNSRFYIERSPIETKCYDEVLRTGALIRIKAPRQMGKTSLMARILHYAHQQHYRTVALSFQLADAQIFTNLDKFLQWFCANIALELDLPIRLDEYWQAIFGSKVACKSYFERYILKSISQPLVLGLDEVDRVFQYPELAVDFLGLLRAWHEESKNREIWQKLRLVVVHSTEVYIPMDINQSPFNVGLPIDLPELTREQIEDLINRYELTPDQICIDELIDLVGGHPYLTRLALYYIARQEMSWQNLLSNASTDMGIFGDHLRRHLWSLQQIPELAMATHKVMSADQPVQLESIPAFKLHSMGLVNLHGNLVTPRCRLYKNYLTNCLSKKAV
jgi:class 3 adenylate cyclase